MPVRALLAVVMLSSLSCIGPLRHTAPEERVLLYGSFKVPNGYDRLRLQRQFSPFQEEHYLDADGNFAFTNLAPGNYVLAGFYQGHRFFSLHTLGSRFWFELKPGEMKFAGAFEVTDFSPGAFTPGSFDMQEREDVVADQVLRALRPGLEQTQWAAKVPGSKPAKKQRAKKGAKQVATPAPR